MVAIVQYDTSPSSR